MEYDVNSVERFIPKVGQVPNVNNVPGKISGKVDKSKFDAILTENIKSKGVVISFHAQERLNSDGIDLDEDELGKIDEALKKLKDKGSRESLILSKDYALIASVSNKTIITAMSGDRLKENVWTNIDSAILI